MASNYKLSQALKGNKNAAKDHAKAGAKGFVSGLFGGVGAFAAGAHSGYKGNSAESIKAQAAGSAATGLTALALNKGMTRATNKSIDKRMHSEVTFKGKKIKVHNTDYNPRTGKHEPVAHMKSRSSSKLLAASGVNYAATMAGAKAGSAAKKLVTKRKAKKK
jgi:hypothetical protein